MATTSPITPRSATVPTKLAILLAWMVFSISVSALLTSNSPARLINGFVADRWTTYEGTRDISPAQYLQSYNLAFRDPAPVSEVLDLVFAEEGWQSPSMLDRVKKAAPRDDLRRIYYVDLFDRVRLQLTSTAYEYREQLTSKANDDQQFSLPLVVGYPFVDKTETRMVDLPVDAITWMKRLPQGQREASERDLLFDSLVCAISLGSLGSLVYLIADLLMGGKDSVLSFGLRPLLGIFMSVAFFVVLVVAHSLISTSTQSDVRFSTMYGIALAAGLLSDKAYQMLKRKLSESLDGLQAGKLSDDKGVRKPDEAPEGVTPIHQLR